MQQLRHYARVMQRWLLLMLLGILICSGATFGISKFILSPVYQATALIQVNGPLIPTNTSTGGNDIFSDQALAVGYSVLITSTDVLQTVTQKVPGVSLTQLQSAVSASPQASTQIIEVRAQANNPLLAADIANTVVRVFIQVQVDKVAASLKSQDAKISQDLLTTNAAIGQIQSQLTALQKSGAPPDAIARENNTLATYQANYSTLLTSQQKIQLQENQANNALIVAQTATPPDQLSSPHILLNTIIAATLGLLLMIVLALLLDWLDSSIQTPEDVVRLAQLEPLGSVPFSKRPLLLANIADPSEANDEAIEQTFTAMAIGTSFSALHHGQHVLLVTGLRMGAGVTTTATNLAISLARSGKRVLLVDANLHRPSLHEIFHCPNTGGFTNSLTDGYQSFGGTMQPQLNFWRTSIPNLWLLPVGSTATHMQIVQYLQRLRALTDRLLGKTQNMLSMVSTDTVDIIIFDAPVLNEGVDAIALASVTDYSILVVDAGKERNETVTKAGAAFQELGSPMLGVVVNRQTARHRPYFYIDDRNQKTVPARKAALEEPIDALLTAQTVWSNTLLASSQTSQRDGSTGQALTDGGAYNPPVAITPSTRAPLRNRRLSSLGSGALGLEHYNGENPK